MDWSSATWWWIAGGVLVALEMTTGTFYLLMLAIGAAAAALAAHAGLRVSGQLLVAALCGSAAVAAWHWRGRSALRSAAGLPLDVGATVQVPQWLADGTARIDYRGAPWDARYVGAMPARPGAHVIRAIEGSCLLLDR